VDYLIAKGADMKAVCCNGRTLFHCAAAGGLVNLMGRLLKEGSPLDGPDSYARTPLYHAAQAGSVPGAEFLLSKGAKVMARSLWGVTPLHVATFTGRLGLLEVLVEHGADINARADDGDTPLLYISQAGREEVIGWLLEHGARLDVRNDFNETPLSFPLVNGFQDLVEKLWPRAEALKKKDLLEKYPLHRAAYLGYVRPAAFLLAKGLPIDLGDESGRTPFHRAAQGGNVELAQMLLAKGAAVDARDLEGSTPLHLAVKKGRTDMVGFLLQKGTDPKKKDGQGRTPLDLAVEYSYPAVAGKLTAAGAKPSAGGSARDLTSLLAKPLRDGEAIVWHLGHCGFGVKTRSRLMIFDYWPREPAPEKPSLANGFVNPDEIKDQNVTVFVSHNHSDHFDPVILSWRPVVKKITYVFGWNARKGERTIDLAVPRATKTLDGMDIFTVNAVPDDVPEVAYLVKVDGLSIYHSGDYLGTADSGRADMDYLLGKAGAVDLAFIGNFQQAEWLRPKLVFPIHAGGREYMYGAFARKAAAKHIPSRVILPENKGDRFMLTK
ncbi:MAG: ankyrin repeat domain-containing protein, partial [Candidatus Aminicenantes bacterium]|nr:ankyrin repeat domain-containing protein [Candidatus Aminicenantes bacterium]